MSWTLTLSLILPAIVFVAFMHQTIQKIKKSAFVYPSEAIIDQSLPPEILEEVLMNLDYKTILACSSVNKYWCYHANKKQIRDLVFSKIGQSRATIEELQSNLKDRTYDLSTFKWLDYPKDYSPQWHIEDKLVADRQKKTIIDADSASLVKLKIALGAPAYGPYHNAGNAAKYLAKMRLEASHVNDKDWLFRNNDSNYFTVPKETIPPHWQFSPGSTVEVIADLPYVQQHYSQFPNFYSYRTMETAPKVVGLIRLNTNILYILFFWYAPCVIVDYWASTNPNKFWVDLMLGLIGAAGQAFIAGIVLWDGISDVNNRKRAATIFIPTILIIIGLLFIFSVWAREVFYLTSLAAGCFIYAGLASDYYKKGGFEFRMFVLFTAYCMVISMNDWRLTVDAFRSSEIWFTFLKNFSLYLVIVIYAIVVNFLRHCVQNWKLDVPALIRWERNTAEFLALNAISIVFISLYGPVTTRFIKDTY